jgi:hypothetical protein
MMPDPGRLSAVSHSALVCAGSRWLSFARGLSRKRVRTMLAADTRAFIESLYGGKFKAVEDGAFSLDKVYRTAGGGLFVSETRLSVSVHPRFDLRLLHFAGVRAGSQVFRESRAPRPPSRADVSGRDALHVTNNIVAPSLTLQTWNVSQAGAGSVLPAFGYVSVSGQRARQGQRTESARKTVAPAPASLRLTSLDPRQFATHAPRQEFVSLLLNTYLPAVVSREVLNVRTAGGVSSASAREAAAQDSTDRRFAPGVHGRLPSAWTYAEPSPRRAPGGAVEIRREFHPVEALREQTSAHDARPPLLHLLPPASLLSSLSETSLTVIAGAAGQATYHLSALAPALTLRHLRTHAVPSGARDLLSSLHTFAERFHPAVAGITHAGNATFFTRAGSEPTPRRGLEQVSARRRVISGEAAPGHVTTRGLFGRSAEFVRPASAAVFTREASTHGAGAQRASDLARGVFSTRGATGAGTLLLTKALLRRSEGGSAVGAMSPAAATERALSETRAARPEGMALEMVRQRREGVLQLPQPGYVFTQPARAQLEERQVITKASREEIVEVVRKEVRALTSSTPAAAAHTRAELAGVADEVYSTLVRRLLVEKERLGRF